MLNPKTYLVSACDFKVVKGGQKEYGDNDGSEYPGHHHQRVDGAEVVDFGRTSDDKHGVERGCQETEGHGYKVDVSTTSVKLSNSGLLEGEEHTNTE